MNPLVAILSLAVLIQGIRMRWRTWKTPAYYATLRTNLILHALIPCAIVGWGLVVHQRPAQEAVDAMVRTFQGYGRGLGLPLVALGWTFAVLHLLRWRDSGIVVVIFGWCVMPIGGFLLFWMGLAAAGQGGSVVVTLAVLALGFASLGVLQTVLAPLVAAVNLMWLVQAFPGWSPMQAVDFLTGAFDLFEVQHQGLQLCLLLVSTALTFADQFGTRE